MDRTNFEKYSSAGSKIVAEIGAEKISEADLDARHEASGARHEANGVQ